MFRFTPIGGGSEIGANSYYINLNDIGIILDCGMHPQKEGLEALPDFDFLEDKTLDYALISHAHQDHIGSLPFLIKRFPFIKIIATPQTRAAAELTLHGSVKLIREQLSGANIKIYTHDEVDLLVRSIFYKEYNSTFQLSNYYNTSKINCTFFNAGHIAGSSAIYIETAEHKILYTGDISLRDQILLPKADIKNIKADILISETTYGSTDTSNYELKKEIEKLSNAFNKTFIKGGSVLIPVFSLGKMQEMTALLHNLIKKGKIPNVDIFTDGLGRKINRIYDYNRYVIDYNNTDLVLEDIPQKRLYKIQQAEELFRNPSIILAAPGMVFKGSASYNLAKKFLSQKKSSIFVVGYMDTSTPGYIISKAKKGDEVILSPGERKIKVECEIKNFRFPSHAVREDLLKMIYKLKPKHLILTHGEEDSMNYIAQKTIEKIKTRIYLAQKGKEIIIEQ